MPKLTIIQGNTQETVWFEGTPNLSAVLQQQGLYLEMPCGGRGVCGKCKVNATGALSPETDREHALSSRLACQTRLLGDARVVLPRRAAMENIAATGEHPSYPLQPMEGRYGLAVDIGTTTLAASLVSLSDGEVLATETAENPQRSVAADVIGRMEAAMGGQSKFLQDMVQRATGQLRQALCAKLNLTPDVIHQTVMTGNTTMLYLLTGRNPTSLSRAPFQADCLFGQWTTTPWAHTYLPHCIGAFVGADITCALLASQMCHRQETALLMDVGTNGEIALWHRGKLYACATAAGPAFEGGGMECGSGSVSGAIDRVWAENGKLICTTIGNLAPVGICGSGVIDAVATLLKQEQLDDTGMLEKERIVLDGAVVLTQKDVRNVQMAKSAIAAGVLTLCQHVGITAQDVDALYLAGGFGKHMDLQNAAAIGLIPQALIPRTRVIGNAALVGAEMLLLQTDFLAETETYAHECEIVVLSGNAAFSDYYIDCMTLEPV